MKIFCQILLFLAVLKSWKYEIRTYKKDSLKYFEILNQQDDNYEFITQTIVLEDGKQVVCQIPLTQQSFHLFNSNQEEDTEEAIQEDAKVLGDTHILTELESMPYLNNLHNQCTQYRTHEFLWQYCFRKFLRQYDDEITVANEKKTHFEVYYLGFAKKFTNSTNTSKVLVNQQSYNLLINDKNNSQRLEIIGRVGKAINVQLNMYKKNVIVMKGLRVRIQKVFDAGQTFLLYQGEEQKIQGTVIDYLIEYEEELRPPDQNVYENFIYLAEGSALTQFKVGSQVAIILKDIQYRVKLSKIKSIWTDNLIEIDENLQTKKIKYVENIENFNQYFEELQWSSDPDRVINIVRRYIYNAWGLKQGDSVKIYSRNQFHYPNTLINSKTCKIMKLFHNIAVLDSDCSTGQSNYVIVGRSPESFSKQGGNMVQEGQKLGIQLISQINFLNTSLNKYGNINLLAFKPDAALLSFYLSVSQNRDTFGLRMLFTSSLDDVDGIELYITDSSINIKQVNEKKTINKKNDYFRNSTFVNRQIWVLFHNKQILVGCNSELKYLNLVTIFDYSKLNYTLQYGKILQRRTNNLVLKNIKIEDLNQGIIKSYGQIMLRPNQTEIPYNDVLYQEPYTGGDYCAPVKAARSVTVLFQCAETWFEIIKIEEPSMCNYQLYIGTNLLCFDKNQNKKNKKKLSDDVDTINCVLQ